MIIIAHRGYWSLKNESNSEMSFKNSFQMGFGVETDIRDYKGNLVISHDIPSKDSMLVQSFFDLYNSHGNNTVLALNIKSDGLQSKLNSMLNNYNIKNYFVFDAAIPDGLLYIKMEMSHFTRQSEYETNPALYSDSEGVWMDEFEGHWIRKKVINEHLLNHKKVCIVSPELHGRPFQDEWEHYKKIEKDLNTESIMICTDYPKQAQEFFNEQ